MSLFRRVTNGIELPYVPSDVVVVYCHKLCFKLIYLKMLSLNNVFEDI